MRSVSNKLYTRRLKKQKISHYDPLDRGSKSEKGGNINVAGSSLHSHPIV